MDRAAVERRVGDHGLRHPTLPERSTGWATITDGVRRPPRHGDRPQQRVPLLLPGLRQDREATSPSSNIVNAIPRTVPSAPRSSAAAPTNLSGQVRLTWLAPASNGGSAVTDYIIQRSPNGTSAG